MKTYIQKNIMINPDLWEKAKILSDTWGPAPREAFYSHKK